MNINDYLGNKTKLRQRNKQKRIYYTNQPNNKKYIRFYDNSYTNKNRMKRFTEIDDNNKSGNRTGRINTEMHNYDNLINYNDIDASGIKKKKDRFSPSYFKNNKTIRKIKIQSNNLLHNDIFGCSEDIEYMNMKLNLQVLEHKLSKLANMLSQDEAYIPKYRNINFNNNFNNIINKNILIDNKNNININEYNSRSYNNKLFDLKEKYKYNKNSDRNNELFNKQFTFGDNEIDNDESSKHNYEYRNKRLEHKYNLINKENNCLNDLNNNLNGQKNSFEYNNQDENKIVKEINSFEIQKKNQNINQNENINKDNKIKNNNIKKGELPKIVNNSNDIKNLSKNNFNPSIKNEMNTDKDKNQINKVFTFNDNNNIIDTNNDYNNKDNNYYKNKDSNNVESNNDNKIDLNNINNENIVDDNKKEIDNSINKSEDKNNSNNDNKNNVQKDNNINKDIDLKNNKNDIYKENYSNNNDNINNNESKDFSKNIKDSINHLSNEKNENNFNDNSKKEEEKSEDKEVDKNKNDKNNISDEKNDEQNIDSENNNNIYDNEEENNNQSKDNINNNPHNSRNDDNIEDNIGINKDIPKIKNIHREKNNKNEDDKNINNLMSHISPNKEDELNQQLIPEKDNNISENDIIDNPSKNNEISNNTDNQNSQISQDNISPSKESNIKNNKKVTFDERLIYINYDEDDEATMITLTDNKGRNIPFKEKDFPKYLRMMTSISNTSKLKPILVGKHKKNKNKKKTEIMKRNIEFIKEVEKTGNIFSTSKDRSNISNTSKERAIKKYNLENGNICSKFTENPQRFFTEDLCDAVLRSYNLIPNVEKKEVQV